MRFSTLIKGLREAGRPIRIVGLKPRQTGLTTISTAHVYHRTALFPNVESRIVSNDMDSAQSIHSKNELFWERCPDEVRPMRARASVREMFFDNPNRKKRLEEPGLGSRIMVNTAKKVGLGRSHTIHNFLGSEVAYWTDGAEKALAVMNAVPEEDGTMVIMESTANGVGDYFHDLWLQANRVGSIWVPFFFPWYEHGEYVYDPDDDWHAKDLSKDELELMETFKLSEAQIAWRRRTIAEKCNDDEDLFRQEYPATPEEAFIFSGRPAFSREAIKAYREDPDSIRAGDYIKLARFRTESGMGVREERVLRSNLKVYVPPIRTHLYVIGVDCATGVEGGDYQCAQVIDVHKMEQVAVYHSLEEPGKYADAVHGLGRYYRTAIVAVEKNGDGINVLTRLMERGYPNLYKQRQFDSDNDKATTKYGWLTNDMTKRLIMGEMQNAIRLKQINLHDGDTLDELSWMQRDKRGKFEAPKGKNDDRVMALAIAWFIAREEAVQRLQVEELPFADPILIHHPLQEREKQYRRERIEDLPWWSY